MTWFDMLVFAAVPAMLVMAGVLLLKKKNEVKKTKEDGLTALTAAVKKSLNARAQSTETAEHIRNCCGGMPGPRLAVKNAISAILSDREIDEEKAGEYLDKEDAYICFLYLYKYYEASEGTGAFGRIWEEHFKEEAEESGEVTEKIVKDVYSRMPQEDRKSFEVLVELIYQRIAGLGAIDLLNWARDCVEEIQLGLSGKAKENYDLSLELDKRIRNIREEYSHDSVHVIIGGRLIKLSFISFKEDSEVIRILRNLIRNTVSGELSGRNPMVVVDTVDGRRVSVCRPPVTDAWVGLIRKFDTVRLTTLDQLVPDEKLRELLKDIVRSGRSIAVTGEMASGKTTLLRALLLEIGERASIRVIEAESFELNVREYMPHANSLTLRISKDQGMDDVIAFSKKTTGQVFVIGEVNSPTMAAVVISVSRIAGQVLFTAHYKQTEDMVSDFTGAQMMREGYTDEAAARNEAVKALGVDIHLINDNGKRAIAYINEVVNGEIRTLYRA